MRYARIATPVVASAVLTACIGVEAVQPVANEAQAIRMANERCALTRPFDAREQWHAREHEGQWHVWLVRDRDPKEPVVGALDIWIRAKDGKAGACNHPS